MILVEVVKKRHSEIMRWQVVSAREWVIEVKRMTTILLSTANHTPMQCVHYKKRLDN